MRQLKKSHAFLKNGIICSVTCPQCKGAMKVISVIDQPEGVKHLLQHLGLREMQKWPPPKIKSPPSDYYSDEQISTYDNVDPDYLFEAYM